MKSEKEKVGRLACRVVRPDSDFDPNNNSRPALLVLLHGYGANAEDLRPLAEFFARSVTTRPLFVLVPDAPFGDWARSWFEIEDALKALKQHDDDVAVSSSTSLSSPPVPTDERPSLSELVPSVADSISQLVECVVLFAETELQKNNKKEEKDWELVIGGFSQGGMMALELLSFLPLPLLSRLSFLALWSTLSLSPRRLVSSLGRFPIISDTKTNEIEKDKDSHKQDRYYPRPPIDATPGSTPATPLPVVSPSSVLKPQPQVLRIEQSHGEADAIVPLSQALRLSSLLAALPPSSFAHRLFLFPGQHELCPEALHSLLEHLNQTR